MEENEDDNMEVDDVQELVIIQVRDKGRDTKFLKAYSTSARLATIQINHSKHSGAVVCEICSLSVTSMAALERHQKAKHSNRTFWGAEWTIMDLPLVQLSKSMALLIFLFSNFLGLLISHLHLI